MPRPIWSGTISPGSSACPYGCSATESKEFRFRFLDKRDLQPIGYDKVRRDTGKHVDNEDVVRGFEVEKGRYVPLEDEDIDRLDIELTKTIDICDFVDLDEIDPVYYRKAYYLPSQEGGEKPYRLFVRALEETGKVGIAKVVIRNNQHLAALRHRKELLDLLRAKAKGEPLPEPQEAEGGELVDLMAALRESVERTKKQSRKRSRAKKAS